MTARGSHDGIDAFGVVFLVVEPQRGLTKSRLVMAEHGISVDEGHLAWAEIGWVHYGQDDFVLNGIHQETTFSLDVASSDTALSFKMKGKVQGWLWPTRGYEFGAVYEPWSQAVAIVDQLVCDRLVADAVAAVHQGDTVEVGGVRIDLEGVHRGGPFKRTVPWSELVGVEMGNGVMRVLAQRRGAVKRRIMVSSQTWNAVILPRVVESLRALQQPSRPGEVG